MKAKLKITRPTAREERAINAGIRRDPDTYALSTEEFKELKPVLRGRPKSAVKKTRITVRVDPYIAEHFRKSGRGWQTRLNDELSKVVARQKR